jgi:formamidopyrimidine-DNA glycosylase
VPELPEVEHTRGVLEAFAKGRTLAHVACADDRIVFAGGGPDAVANALGGRRVRRVLRRGKYTWLELDRSPHPVFHLGMTGTWRYPGDEPLVLESSPKNPDRTFPPRFWKIHLTFDDGRALAMTDPRRLGRIVLRGDPEAEPPISKLGFDPLTDMPPVATFRALLGKRKGVLKGVLLDQSFAAGVGNWIADEVLFQARLDPRRTVASLSSADVARLHAKIRSVVATAVGVDARSDRFPSSWLFHRRWGKAKDAKTARGERIEHITLAGRTTAWVPAVQK